MKQAGFQRGVSLIEALVAMAVMGFGMLGVMGLQSSLRGNADVSKQRSEAVRIAQETIETARAFSVLGAAPGAAAYDTVLSATTDITRANANSTFNVVTTVTTLPASGNEDVVAPHKQVVVKVGWRDRNNELQTLSLATMVGATAPETAAALGTPGDAAPVQRPLGRNPVIPPQAANLGNGTSTFTPPGASPGVSWTFNNATGFITQQCISASCTAFPGRLVTGFVNFAATGTSAPTGADAETPPGPIVPTTGGSFTVQVIATTVGAAGTVTCFQPAVIASSYISYYCAVPVTAVAPFNWSGRVELVAPAGLTLATSISDPSASAYRVCRYTTVQSQATVGTGTPPLRNEDHPLDYVDVANSLAGQNFLVIRAGNGGSPFACPGDDASTPDVNGTTWHHQPSA